MTVKRLRQLPTPDELAAMYATPHDHRLWGQGHHDRVEATIELARESIAEVDRQRVADLSCGNGVIASALCSSQRGWDDLHLGDLAALDGSWLVRNYHGPIEETIHLIPEVDVFVCSETIEHLDDPGHVLELVRSKAQHLVLSTPVDCWDDTNGEHCWAWDCEGVEDLAASAGWSPVAFERLPTEAYTYGIWVMS